MLKSLITNPIVQRIIFLLNALTLVGGAAFAVFSFVQPPSDQRILWWADSRLLLTPSANFPTAFAVVGKSGLTEQIYETVATVWRAEGRPIDHSDVRAPLAMGLAPNATILSMVPVATQTTVEGSPDVNLVGDQIQVSWTVFDPKMAIKFAILSAGERPEVRILNDVGPNVIVQQNYPTLQQYIVIGVAFVVLAFATVGAAAAYASRQYDRAAERKGGKLTKEEAERAISASWNLAILLGGLILTMILVWQLFLWFRPAMPLQLASVTGL